MIKDLVECRAQADVRNKVRFPIWKNEFIRIRRSSDTRYRSALNPDRDVMGLNLDSGLGL